MRQGAIMKTGGLAERLRAAQITAYAGAPVLE